MDVDHIDGNKNNDHISNLRQLTKAENSRAFQRKRANSTSRYRGVWLSSTGNRWESEIYERVKGNKQRHRVGTFNCEHMAAMARDRKAVELGFSKEGLNFPEHYETYLRELKSQQTLKI
jgi:predicted dithiol-disulfide oxidoreductase (DUF899 family)